MREMKNAYRIWWETPKGRNHLNDLGIDWKDIKMDLTGIRCEVSGWPLCTR